MKHEETDFDILAYVQDNIAGICLLILAFVIVYIVDLLANYNAHIFAPLPIIPGIAVVPAMLKKRSNRKTAQR